MRVLRHKETGTELNIIRFIILKNYWEYFVTDEQFEDTNIWTCLVMGFETEVGDVDMDEIKPFIMCNTEDLKDVITPPEWEWKIEKKEKL